MQREFEYPDCEISFDATVISHHKRSLLLTAGALAQQSALDEATVEETQAVPLHIHTAKSLSTG
jgi:hypothetical protein